MALRLYNTLTRTKETFVPIDSARVRVYACGPTVYDFAHIGNARPVIVFDVLFRLLRHLYGPDHVVYVRNITDVDDKINARAAERGVSIREVTEETAQQFRDDVAALGNLPPTVEPRATEHIAEMRVIIERLVAAGHAYVAEEHVLFHVPSMTDYGSLSKRPLDEMEAGARVDVAPYKRSPLDFVLWKPSPPDWPAWPSPAGIATPGRPGWHIECSAMAWRHLGETFDIHAGGIDLTFPHHENEIAQSRCCFGTDVMANIWMHNGFLQVEGQKMSKSLGNFLTIREVLRGWRGRPWSGRAVRLLMLKTHYQQPLDWTPERLLEASADLAHYARIISEFKASSTEAYDRAWETPPSEELVSFISDDLNTPEALAYLRRVSNEIDPSSSAMAQLIADIKFLNVLESTNVDAHRASIGSMAWGGFPADLLSKTTPLAFNLKAYVANNDLDMISSTNTELALLGCKPIIGPTGVVTIKYERKPELTVDDLIEKRRLARNAKDWEESDRIRDKLLSMGVKIKDNKDGTTSWEVVR